MRQICYLPDYCLSQDLNFFFQAMKLYLRFAVLTCVTPERIHYGYFPNYSQIHEKKISEMKKCCNDVFKQNKTEIHK